MSPKFVDKDEKRIRIAHDAIVVFGNKGFERTRMDDVAREAGVGKGTIYEYFKNKEELMQGAMDVMLAGMSEMMMPELGPDVTSIEILRATTFSMIEAMEHMGSTYRFFLEYILHKSRNGEDFGVFGTMVEEYRQGIAAVIDQGKQAGEIREDVDSYETAAAFIAWFDGAIFHWLLMPKSLGLKAMGERFLQMTMTGIQTTADTQEGGK
jgi:AcrR family transcriptional regulator